MHDLPVRCLSGAGLRGLRAGSCHGMQYRSAPTPRHPEWGPPGGHAWWRTAAASLVAGDPGRAQQPSGRLPRIGTRAVTVMVETPSDSDVSTLFVTVTWLPALFTLVPAVLPLP